MEYCKEMIIMDKEQQRLSILEYYVGGKLCNPDHSKAVIKGLIRNKLSISEELSCNSNPLSKSL